MATIVILEHRLQREVKLPYMVYAMAERWRELGHRVIVHHGLEDAPAADLAVNNVDLTRTPEAYAALFSRYPRVINGRVLDVSKSRFSQSLLSRDDPWPGPVIVKTEANFGGKPEALLRSIARERGLACDDVPAGPVAEGYPTYASLAQVPAQAWTTPGLVVEKFIPERDERQHYVRVWLFCGARERSSRWSANVPIVKSENMLEREDAQVPDELRAWRERLGFDFGKFDYVKAADGFALLDVNRTPTAPPTLPPQAKASIRFLAEGIEAFLP